MPKLLIVDDEPVFHQQLAELMKPDGWTVELAVSGGDALQLMENFHFDFILLDWSLPDFTGLEVCQRFRAMGKETPIIFLTGRTDVEAKEAGLDAGGDDYVTKPFEVRELLARIRSVHRRPRQLTHDRFQLPGMVFNPRLHMLVRGDEQVQLSPTESSLLEVLCRHAGSFYSSAQLFEAVWPSEANSSDEAVRVHVRVLRRKLGLVGCEELLKTVRGSGYYIDVKDVKLV